MWPDCLVVCDCSFSPSALWCPLSAPTILLGFSYLGHGVSLHGCSSKAQPLLLPWPWGISSWMPLLTLDMGYLLLTAPDLEHESVEYIIHLDMRKNNKQTKQNTFSLCTTLRKTYVEGNIVPNLYNMHYLILYLRWILRKSLNSFYSCYYIKVHKERRGK